MAGNSPQGIFSAVEKKTLLGVDLETAAAKPGGDHVQFCLTPNELCFCSVQVRVLAAIPQVGIFQDKFCLFLFAAQGENSVALCIQDPESYPVTGLLILDIGLQGDLCVNTLHNGGHIQAGTTQTVQLKVCGGNGHDLHTAVQTAVEGKVCGLGINSLVGGVIHQNSQTVVISQGIGDIHTPCGVAAVVVSQMFAVHVGIGRGVGTVDLQIILFALRQLCFGDHSGIAAGTAEIIVAAVLTVFGVPGMG